MIAIILNYHPLLYPFCLKNNSGDQGIPSEPGYITLEEIGENLWLGRFLKEGGL